MHSLNETRAFWQSHTSRKLTLEDARETHANLITFFAILGRWDARLKSDVDREERKSEKKNGQF
jgi:hypothetical protein